MSIPAPGSGGEGSEPPPELATQGTGSLGYQTGGVNGIRTRGFCLDGAECVPSIRGRRFGFEIRPAAICSLRPAQLRQQLLVEPEHPGQGAVYVVCGRLVVGVCGQVPQLDRLKPQRVVFDDAGPEGLLEALPRGVGCDPLLFQVRLQRLPDELESELEPLDG